MTRESFIVSCLNGRERFNATRRMGGRVKDSETMRKWAGEAFDLYAANYKRDEAKVKLKSIFVISILARIAWWWWGDDLIEWILSKLFATQGVAAREEKPLPMWAKVLVRVLAVPVAIISVVFGGIFFAINWVYHKFTGRYLI